MAMTGGSGGRAVTAEPRMWSGGGAAWGDFHLASCPAARLGTPVRPHSFPSPFIPQPTLYLSSIPLYVYISILHFSFHWTQMDNSGHNMCDSNHLTLNTCDTQPWWSQPQACSCESVQWVSLNDKKLGAAKPTSLVSISPSISLISAIFTFYEFWVFGGTVSFPSAQKRSWNPQTRILIPSPTILVLFYLIWLDLRRLSLGWTLAEIRPDRGWTKTWYQGNKKRTDPSKAKWNGGDSTRPGHSNNSLPQLSPNPT